jgi:hypothetical protein
MTGPTPTATIRQSDIEELRTQYRIADVPVAVRTERIVEAGGFADASRNPNTWTAYLLVDGQWAQIQSARGLRREWTSLDRLERWLRSMGFTYFSVRNDLEPSGKGIRSGNGSMK